MDRENAVRRKERQGDQQYSNRLYILEWWERVQKSKEKNKETKKIPTKHKGKGKAWLRQRIKRVITYLLTHPPQRLVAGKTYPSERDIIIIYQKRARQRGLSKTPRSSSFIHQDISNKVCLSVLFSFQAFLPLVIIPFFTLLFLV